MNMVAYFLLDSEILYLPYTTQFEIDNSYEDEEIENILGDKYFVFGNKKLRTFELSGFITKNKNNFFNKESKTELSDYINFFEKSRKNKQPLRIVISSNDVVLIDMDCLVDFKYSNLDGVGDINFVIEVKEFKNIKGRI